MPGAESVKRLLIVRNDRIGDLVLTLPAIEAARRALPRARIAVLVSAYTAPLVARHGDVDEVLVDDPADGAQRLAARLRPKQFDAALIVNTNTRNALAAFLARIPCRVCWAGKPAGMLLATRRLWLRRSHPPIHEADFALALLTRLGLDVPPGVGVPQLAVDSDARRRVAARIDGDLGGDGPLFGIHPGNKQSAFNWPLENYAALARELCRHGRVMVTGSRAEAPLLARMRELLGSDLAGPVAFYDDLALEELIAALSLQDALTVSSTGPMHLAAVLGTAVIALFSSHRAQVPEKWSPLGRRVMVLRAPLEPGESDDVPSTQGESHMRRISVEQALTANLRCLDDVSVLV